MQDTAPHTLKDGVYRWTAPAEGYRAAQDMEATVSAGRVTAWAYVCEDGNTRPAADCEAYGEALARVLAHEVSEAARLPGLLRPVSFQPAPVPLIRQARAAKGAAA